MSIVKIGTEYHYVLFFDTEIDSSRGANTGRRCAVCAVLRHGGAADSGGGRAAQLLL